MKEPRYGSDFMADLIADAGLRYLALNPGSSFRGLHDSLVNRVDDRVEIIECPHEKIAVGLAHGYAKATGEVMGVVLHDLVGLLHGTMGIYYAYTDRVPVVVFGGSGPAAYERRRPGIDWVHSAHVQGDAVRQYTKWIAEPATLASVPQAIARARRVALSEPQGPVYLSLDAGLQEDSIEAAPRVPTDQMWSVPSRIGPAPEELSALAAALTGSERPLVVVGHAGRVPEAFGQLVQLSQILSAGVIDTHDRLNFPNRNPLHVGTEALGKADCVLFLDVVDKEKYTHTIDQVSRSVRPLLSPDCTVLDLGFQDLGISSWSDHHGSLQGADLQVTADTAVALPALVDLCGGQVEANPDLARRRMAWHETLTGLHEKAREHGRAEEARHWDDQPISTARLSAEVWDVVREYDWVLCSGTAEGWALQGWDFDQPYRHPGKQLGTATQISIALGVALAHKGTGRLVVDLQPDGDLMFDVGALWVAAYYRLPLLVVMVNNRAYYNDWNHQAILAEERGTPVERAYIGMEIDNPAPDFASLARGFSWYAEGPVTDPKDIQESVRRAADHVMSSGLPALVDVVCRRR